MFTMKQARHFSPPLHAYIEAHRTPPDPVLQELLDETAERFPEHAHLQIDPAQGPVMTVLTRIAKTTSAIEVGTFTGYSSICIARGLRPGGKLICCDINDEWTTIARKYWEKAGLEDRIELRLGMAIDTIRSFPAEPAFDLAFIDGDKQNYLAYWEELVPRMRPGGLIIADNTFWHGGIVGTAGDGRLVYLMEFNHQAGADPRAEVVHVPVGDGLLLACVGRGHLKALPAPGRK
jgi:caffeoyl-CoA O-methyltransferase